MPFGAVSGANQHWIATLSTHLVGSGARVVWGQKVAPNPAPPPKGVVAYPYSDLEAGPLETPPPGGPLLLNIDGPSPYADRTRHLWRSFNMGAGDVFFLPEARLADLEALWEIYAFTDISQAPCTLVRLSEISPGARTAMSYDEIIERLRWIAYRLDTLDLPGKKIVFWPASTLIAHLLERAGLPVTEVIPVGGAGESRGALVALGALGEDEERLIARVSDHVGGRPVDVVCQSATDVARFKSAVSFDVQGVGAPLAAHYETMVVAADLLFAVARAGIDCDAGRAFILDDAEGEPWGALDVPARDQPARPAPTPDKLAARLVELTVDAAKSIPEPRPVVVHIAPTWPSAGSTHVFQGQLDWLRKRGLPTICLHLDTADFEWNDVLSDVPDLLTRLPGKEALHRWFLSRPSEERQFEATSGISPPYSHLSLEGEERISRQVRLPSSLIAFLRHRQVHFVVLNYGHNWPMVERLGLEGHPVALEAHDIRPLQHALYNTAPVIESAIDVELAMFARATCAVFINRQEKAAFEKAYPNKPAVSAFPFRDAPLPTPVRSRFETAASSLLSASQLSLDVVRDIFLPRSERRRRFAVFVGSNHAANITSLQWFFLNAYPEGLIDPDLVIIVAGAIDEAFVGAQLPNVIFCGRLSELDLLYKAADVLLLAVTAGTGLPIKTLDALTAGVPFVATSKAMEAIPGLTELAGAHDDGRAFAAQARRLAFDDAARARFTRKLDDYRVGNASQGAYEQSWDEALTAMKVPLLEGPRSPDSQGFTRYVDRPAGRLNQRYYFWSGHGLEEMIGAQQEGDGLMLEAPYVRVGLSCTPTFAAGADSRQRLELTARMTATEKTRALIALQGTVRGSIVLEAGRPMRIALDAPRPSRGRPDRLSLEIRLETPGGETPGPVHLQELSATSLS